MTATGTKNPRQQKSRYLPRLMPFRYLINYQRRQNRYFEATAFYSASTRFRSFDLDVLQIPNGGYDGYFPRKIPDD